MRLEHAYGLDEYKTKFPSYGRLDYVSDDDEIDKLNSRLFSLLKSNDYNKIHLSPGTIIDDNISYFTYKDPETNESPNKFDELNIEDLISQNHPFTKRSSIQTILKWRVYTISTTGEISSMNAYDCLNCELLDGEITYILSAGTWRNVSSEFKTDVETYIKNNIEDMSKNYLPDNISIRTKVNEKGVETVKYKEDIYNSFAAQNNPDIFLFDKSKIIIAGNKLYEICDLLHKDRELIHVKVLKGGSNSLSHLFVQSKFYTDAFIKDSNTRESMIKFIKENKNEENKNKEKNDFLSIIKKDRSELQESSFSVLLCILTFSKDKCIEDLPFMVKYELASTHKYLATERGIKLRYAIKVVNKS